MVEEYEEIKIQGVNLMGKIRGERVGYIDGEYVMKKNIDEMKE